MCLKWAHSVRDTTIRAKHFQVFFFGLYEWAVIEAAEEKAPF